MGLPRSSIFTPSSPSLRSAVLAPEEERQIGEDSTL